MPRIRLQPLDIDVELAPERSLADALFAHGVEFPCGGHGRCRGCRVRVLAGEAPVDAADARAFAARELADGWRLACHLRPRGDCTLELAQWEARILGDESRFDFRPRSGFGVAIDIGTTTLVAQLVDRGSGQVLAVRSALNPQTRHGGDLMTRLEYAQRGGGAELRRSLLQRLERMVDGLLDAAPQATAAVERVCAVGNTAMHHLFAGLDCSGLASYPFHAAAEGAQQFQGEELGWTRIAGAEVVMLPILGGFVGSDLLAGILATGMANAPEPQILVDLGTNGEVVVGNRDGLLATSTAAGPAFEGARIRRGMRAASGAIAGVDIVDSALRCRVLGGGAARGVCGSGLVDAVACGLELERIAPGGRMADELELASGIALHQQDVRELQLAKGAIAAGIGLLTERWGCSLTEIKRVHLAGAFGNYVDHRSARRIGLLPFAEDRIEPIGNSALRGAKIALFADDCAFADLRARVAHRSLRDDPAFEDRYIEAMAYPPPSDDPPSGSPCRTSRTSAPVPYGEYQKPAR